MTLFVAGERRLWTPGLISGTTYLALFGAEGYVAASELSAQAGAAYHAPNYARFELALADWTISTITGAASNAGTVRFAAPGVGVTWPGVVAVALASAVTGGDYLIGAAVSGAPLIATGAGTPIEWEPGQLILDV